MSVESVPDERGDGMPVIERPAEAWSPAYATGADYEAMVDYADALEAEIERLRSVDEPAVERVARRLYHWGHGYDIDADREARRSMLSLAADLLRAARSDDA